MINFLLIDVGHGYVWNGPFHSEDSRSTGQSEAGLFLPPCDNNAAELFSARSENTGSRYNRSLFPVMKVDKVI